jgi:hypothetical protein
MKNKEEILNQLEKDKEQIQDPSLKKEVEKKINKVSQDNTIEK